VGGKGAHTHTRTVSTAPSRTHLPGRRRAAHPREPQLDSTRTSVHLVRTAGFAPSAAHGGDQTSCRRMCGREKTGDAARKAMFCAYRRAPRKRLSGSRKATSGA
jgi:hypothetical protein